MMSYTNEIKNPKRQKTIHPSNTQGEIRSKQGFVMSANNFRVKSPANNYSREELGTYQMQSNRSSGMLRHDYGLTGMKGNDQLNKSIRSQSSLITERELYKSPQFSVVATQ